jgi:hypothetical protein
MYSESEKLTTADRIEAIAQLFYQNEASIMGNAALTQELWERMMKEDMLGELYPTKIVVRALLTNLLQKQNDILNETIMEFFSTGQPPKRTKEPHSKEWFNLLREESNSKLRQKQLTQDGSSTIQHTMIPTIEKMKLELKLETYDGTKDACEDWFFELEKTLRKIKVHEQDFLLYASNNMTGIAKNAACNHDGN